MSELKDTEMIGYLAEEIKNTLKQPLRLMIASGRHYVLSRKYNLSSLLPEQVELIPGPGCPACQISPSYIDQVIAYSHSEKVIITTFEEIMNIPGSSSNLMKEKDNGADIRVVKSLMDALLVAKRHRRNKVVFPGMGFENSAAVIAGTIIQAQMAGLKNFYIHGAYKVFSRVIESLCRKNVNINGFILPCDINLITGTDSYKHLPEKYGKGLVTSGNEVADLMQSILMLVYQVKNNNPGVEIECMGNVTPQGNTKANQLIEEVFELTDAQWQGLGILSASGLKIRDRYAMHNAEINIDVNTKTSIEPEDCICGHILAAENRVEECKLFGNKCTPASPVGSCMASIEGPCFASFNDGH
jgi:hydrogenase expression/formation protein HypD